MTNTLETIFSEDNMLAYSKACLDLAVEIPDFHKKKPFDTLVIPSRGAVPFFLGILYALDRMSEEWEGEFKEFYEALGVQPMLAPLLPPDSRVSNTTHGKKARVLLIPFTADLNVEKFDPTQNNEEYTSSTRIYWANVTASFFKPSEERKNSPYFRSFADVVLRELEGRNYLAEIYEAFPKIGRFAMIDTVISGRASNDILKAFDLLAQVERNDELMPWTFLIVDENGRKLRQDFALYLERKRMTGQVSMYKIPRIVSEDEGASLLGVSAVMYPSIMRSSKGLALASGLDFFVGAGSWYLGSDLETESGCQENFKRFMDLVYSGVEVEYSRNLSGTSTDGGLGKFREKRTDFVRYAQSRKIFAGEPNVAALKLDRRFAVSSPYTTSSQVLHVPFSERATQRVIGKLKDIPEVCVKPRTD